MRGQTKIEFTPEAGGAAEGAGRSESRHGQARSAWRTSRLPRDAIGGRWFSTLLDSRTGMTWGRSPSSRTCRQLGADAEKHPTDDAAAIAYLKEQQWTNAFATARVVEAEVRASIRVPATVHPLPGGEAIVAAPAAGRFTTGRVALDRRLVFARARSWAAWIRGSLPEPTARRSKPMSPKRGRPSRLRASSRSAPNGLLAERAVPARRVEDARRATAVAEARLRAAEARLAQRDETLGTGGAPPPATRSHFAPRSPVDWRR